MLVPRPACSLTVLVLLVVGHQALEAGLVLVALERLAKAYSADDVGALRSEIVSILLLTDFVPARRAACQ